MPILSAHNFENQVSRHPGYPQYKFLLQYYSIVPGCWNEFAILIVYKDNWIKTLNNYLNIGTTVNFVALNTTFSTRQYK